MRKILFILFDGLADWPCPELGDLTPLAAADTPHLDRLSALGLNGRIHPVSPGIPVSTDTAHFVYFGYPLERYPGRAIFEAVGKDVEFDDNDVLLSASFAHVEQRGDRLIVIDHNPALADDKLTDEEIRKAAEGISSFEQEGVNLRLVYTGKGYGTVRLSGPVSEKITDSQLFREETAVLQVQPLEGGGESAERSARVVNAYLRYAWKGLEKTGPGPINFLLVKWAGRRVPLDPFPARTGMRAVSISPKLMMKGFMKELGIDFVHRPGQGDDEDFDANMEVALEKLGSYDFVHLFSTPPDIAAHAKDPGAKKKAIERLDRALGAIDEELLATPLTVVVTTDHATPSRGDQLIHTGDPVPILVVGKGLPTDRVSRFDEVDSASGGIGTIYGRELLDLLLNFSGRANNYGMRPFPKDWSYIPTPDQILPFPP